MTDFLATLALRGAGLPPADGRGALAPRPRALFEPDTSGVPGDATLVERVEDVPAPARSAKPGMAAISLVASDETQAAPVFDPMPRDDARQAATPPPIVVATSADRATPAARDADAAPPRTAATGLEPDEPLMPARTAAIPAAPDSATRPTPTRRTPTERATPPIAATHETPAGADPSVAGVVPQRPATPLRSAPASARLPEAPESRPSVTVSIGRIDVEVAPPPLPTARAQRPAPERTRGFEHYARARRGRPRS